MIELETGDPWNAENKPSSYSRFLLPFSYTLQKKRFLCCKKIPLHFKEVQPNKYDRERLLYFTAETANVLFRRAIWAEIDADLWRDAKCGGPFLFQSVNRNTVLPIEICLAPPRLILFEGGAGNRSSHPTLRHGFLILEAFFPDADPPCERYPCLDDLLEFNELFRYVDCPFPEHSEKFANALAEFPANYVTGGKIRDIKGNKPFFCYKSRWLSLLQSPLLTEKKGCFRLVPENRIPDEQDDRFIENHLACTGDNCLPYADNRAFVWTAAIVKDGGSALAEQYKRKRAVARPWEFGHWCRLLNVDPPDKTSEGSHLVRAFEQKWAEERTYQRWAELGTWYGYSYHSGAMLADALSEPPLWRYFGEMYFDQVLLLFYLRITLFAFSRELTRMNQGDSEQRDEFNLLRASFAKFTNLYQFPLISNQQQGLEMYKVARKSMDIDDLFKEVQEEISSTHEFLEMQANRRLGKMANILTGLAAIIAVGSLLTESFRIATFEFVIKQLGGLWDMVIKLMF